MYNQSHNKGVFIFDGETSNPIGVARGLGRKEIPVYLLTYRKTFVHYSKYVDTIYRVSSWIEQPEEFMKEFIKICENNPNNIVIPTDDASSLLLSKHRKRLDKFAEVVVADYNVVHNLVDKSLFYEKMRRSGIPTLEATLVTSYDKLFELFERYKKLFIKPVDSRARKDYFIIEHKEQLRELRNKLRNNGTFIAQKWIPGHEIYMLYIYIDAKGNLSYCGYDKIRQYPPYAGNGCFVITKLRSGLVEQSINILREYGYFGLAEFEYKYDPIDEKWYILEINPRTTTQSRILDKAGVDVEYCAYRCSQDKKMSNYKDTDFSEGIRWVLEIDDFLCMLKRRKDRTITFLNWLRSLEGSKTYGIWAADDPIPSIHYVLAFIYEKMRKMLHFKITDNRKTKSIQ